MVAPAKFRRGPVTTNFPLRWYLRVGYPCDQISVGQPKRNLGMMGAPRHRKLPRQVARCFRVNGQRTRVEANAKLLVRVGRVKFHLMRDVLAPPDVLRAVHQP